MRSFSSVNSFLSSTFTNKQMQVHANDQLEKNVKAKTEEPHFIYQQQSALLEYQHLNTKQHSKEIKQFKQFKTLPTLQSLFKRPKKSLLKRTRSQISTCSTEIKMSTKSSFSLQFTINNDILESSDSLVSPKVCATSENSFTKDSKMSKKSMEFEALIEEYLSRTFKASLTPSICSAQ